MDLANGVRAAAPNAPETAIRALEAVAGRLEAEGALATALRAAHLIGQCAHESVQFSRTEESLFYSTPSRLCAVWPSRFRNVAAAQPFCRNPQRLANNVYADRMGNGNEASGDGFRYRGRGYLQLTGRSNYRSFGRQLGLDLEGQPELAEHPEIAWLIAARYLATRKRSGKTAFEWADRDDVRTVTRIVNGGTHGLADRRQRTRLALHALQQSRPPRPARPEPRPAPRPPIPAPSVGIVDKPQLGRGARGTTVRTLQKALGDSGHTVKVDGIFGPRTEAAVRRFQKQAGLRIDGICGPNTWAALLALAV